MNDLPTGNFPDYNHNKFENKPGQLWSADEQCRILLRDKAALAFGDMGVSVLGVLRKR